MAVTNPLSRNGVPQELLFAKPGKWDLVVIASLKPGALRFNALRAEIGGISQKVLSSTLRELERNGFVSRTQYPSIPPRVEYELTELGGDLLAFTEAWVSFVKTHSLAIAAARQEFDRLHETGSDGEGAVG
jgi:DNA-binding HxlR family transcriptional regulator